MMPLNRGASRDAYKRAVARANLLPRDLGMKLAASGKLSRLHRYAPRIYPASMTRKLRNWTYRDVTDFLREYGFSYYKPLKGSHQAWRKPGEKGEQERIVKVSIPRDSYHPKTLRMMIWQSGVDCDDWIKWANS